MENKSTVVSLTSSGPVAAGHTEKEHGTVRDSSMMPGSCGGRQLRPTCQWSFTEAR